MGKVIVVTSGKGGVGKTTTTANLGKTLSNMGKRVLVIDADLGLRNLDVALGVENKIVYDFADVLEERCSLFQALIQIDENLFMLAASQTVEKEAIEESQMQKLTKELSGEYDFILIDCPAGIEHGFKNAVIGADTALIVTTPDYAALRDADKVLCLLEDRDIDKYVIVNRINPHLIKKGAQLTVDEIIELLAVDFLGAIAESEEIQIAASLGKTVTHDKKGKAGKEYENIVKRLMGEKIPVQKFSGSKNIFAKNKRKKLIKRMKEN